jgi:hypothetical protein
MNIRRFTENIVVSPKHARTHLFTEWCGEFDKHTRIQKNQTQLTELLENSGA